MDCLQSLSTVMFERPPRRVPASVMMRLKNEVVFLCDLSLFRDVSLIIYRLRPRRPRCRIAPVSIDFANRLDAEALD